MLIMRPPHQTDSDDIFALAVIGLSIGFVIAQFFIR